jgi:hypothetical protein
MNGALNEQGETVTLTERRMVTEGTPGTVNGLRTKPQ